MHKNPRVRQESWETARLMIETNLRVGHVQLLRKRHVDWSLSVSTWLAATIHAGRFEFFSAYLFSTADEERVQWRIRRSNCLYSFFFFFLHFFLFCLCRYALAWLFNIGEVAGLGQVGHRLDSCTEISRFMFSRYKPHDLFFVIIHSFDCRIRRSNCSHTSGPTRWRFVRNLIELTWNMNFFSFFFLKQKKKLV